MAMSTGAGLALAGGAGLASSLIGGGDSGSSKTTTSQKVDPMGRPDEYQTLWDSFLEAYIPKEKQIDEDAYIKKYPDVAKIISQQIDPFYSFMGKTAQGHYDTYGKYEGREATFLPPTDYKSQLETTYKEQREANEEYITKLTGLKEPYLAAVTNAVEKHGGLLDEITSKRMAGDAVGPYGADIDKLLKERTSSDSLITDSINKLLNERTGISFGGGNPMNLITRSQSNVIGDLLKAQAASSISQNELRNSLLTTLLGAQETGLSNIQGASKERAAAGMLPAEKAYGLDKEIADATLSKFMPSNIADTSYLQSLFSMIEPMEMARYHANPSSSAKTTSTASPTQQTSNQLGNINEILNLVTGLKSLFPGSGSAAPEIAFV